MAKSGSILKTMVGAGLAAVAGYYFLSDSKEAKTRRKQLRGWMLRFRADVMDQLEEAKEISAEKYEEAVDTIKEKYENIKDVDKAELEELAGELKGHWEGIKEEVGGVGEAVKKAGKNIITNNAKGKKPRKA